MFSLLAGDALPRVLSLSDRGASPAERLSPGTLSLLRQTPMCHMNPFRDDLDDAGRVAVSEPADKVIGLDLVEAVRPRVLVTDGNRDGQPWFSPWAYALSTAPESPVMVSGGIPPNYSLKVTQFQSGPLNGMTVVGLPTLSHTSDRALEILLGFINERITDIHRAAR